MLLIQTQVGGMMRSEKYEFESHEGTILAGRLELPDNEPKAYAIFAHCFTCTKDFVASRTIAKSLASRGIATLRFDFTGLGNSEGDFGNTNFSSNVKDLVFAAESLAKTHQAPRLLVGHSLGGAAILAAAPYIESATAVATLAAPFDPSHVMHLFKDDIDTIQQEGKTDVDLFGRPFSISKDFIDDINQHNQRERIASMRKALLVMHSPTDQTVGIENAKMIFESAQHPKSFVSLDGMEHLLMNPQDVEYAADILACWAARYIDQEPRTIADTIKVKPYDGKVKLYPTGNGPFSFMVQAGSHHFLADEPISVGGKDSGATPYDFLLAAVGACTAMTLKMYAKHKKINLDDVRVELTQERIHAKDCEDCEGAGDDMVYKIERVISVKGDLTDDQKQRLIEIADKCPVHRTLEGEIAISTRLKE